MGHGCPDDDGITINFKRFAVVLGEFSDKTHKRSSNGQEAQDALGKEHAAITNCTPCHCPDFVWFSFLVYRA
jgi:hypothetical protein